MTDKWSLGEKELRMLRARAQLLDVPRPEASPFEIVQRVCGVQAQDLRAADLALRARAASLTAAEVQTARGSERSVIRTWAMRGTLHLLASDDVGWLLSLIAPRFLPRSRRRLLQLGIEGSAQTEAVALIEKMLEVEGPLTRSEIAERLARRGIRTEGQAAYHLVALAALEGHVCMGPDRGGEPAFVLLRDWLGLQSTLERDAALAELARRYLCAYGPAAPEDMAAWSGLGLTEALKGWRLIAQELSEVDVAGGQKAWALRSQDFLLRRTGFVRLLPSFDNYLLGHRSRDFAVNPLHAREVRPGGGVLRAVVLFDGRAVATWSSRRRGTNLIITVRPFDQLSPRVEEGLEAETRDIGRFLGVSAQLALA